MKQRRLFWIGIAGSSIGLALLVLIAALVKRDDIAARWYCDRLASASDTRQAQYYIQRLWVEPGASTRLEYAVSQLGRRGPQFDFLLLLAARWPYYSLPREFQSVLPPNFDPLETTSSRYFDLLLEEIGRRPELAGLYAHWWRYSRHFDDGTEFDLGNLAASVDAFDQDEAEKYPLTTRCCAVDFAVACWLSGRVEVLRGITFDRWWSVSQEWKAWFDENEAFLRFDPDLGRSYVDLQAKDTGAPTHTIVPATETAVPSWHPPATWLYRSE